MPSTTNRCNLSVVDCHRLNANSGTTSRYQRRAAPSLGEVGTAMACPASPCQRQGGNSANNGEMRDPSGSRTLIALPYSAAHAPASTNMGKTWRSCPLVWQTSQATRCQSGNNQPSCHKAHIRQIFGGSTVRPTGRTPNCNESDLRLCLPLALRLNTRVLSGITPRPPPYVLEKMNWYCLTAWLLRPGTP